MNKNCNPNPVETLYLYCRPKGKVFVLCQDCICWPLGTQPWLLGWALAYESLWQVFITGWWWLEYSLFDESLLNWNFRQIYWVLRVTTDKDRRLPRGGGNGRNSEIGRKSRRRWNLHRSDTAPVCSVLFESESISDFASCITCLLSYIRCFTDDLGLPGQLDATLAF